MDNRDALISGIVSRQKRENARCERQLKRRVREAENFVSTILSAFLEIDPAIRRIVLRFRTALALIADKLD